MHTKKGVKMAYSFKGAIAFGLIYIPVTLHLVIKNNDISFNLLDKNTNSRILYKKTCVDCNDKTVQKEDIVKGYQYEDNKYVIFTDEDFEKIKSKKDKTISIENFVDINEIDPIYFDKAYYVAPTGAEKAYNLLLKAMEDEGKVGIARTVIGSKETLIAIRVRKGEMLLNTLFFNEEVQKNPVKEISSEINEKEFYMAKMLIQNMSEPFDIKNYRDNYRQKVMDAIEQKIAGKEIVAIKETEINTNVLNLMEALEMSLKQNKSAPVIVKKTKKSAKKA